MYGVLGHFQIVINYSLICDRERGKESDERWVGRSGKETEKETRKDTWPGDAQDCASAPAPALGSADSLGKWLHVG